MFSTETYNKRRKVLTSKMESGLVLLFGNDDVGMNYSGNTYHFRQDSTFLYYFGLNQPGLAAIVDLDNGREVIFGDELTMADVVWMGPQPAIQEKARSVGVMETQPSAALKETLDKARQLGRTIHFLPAYRYQNKHKLMKLLGVPMEKGVHQVSTPLIKAIVSQRSIKSVEEIEQIEMAVNTTVKMHHTAMQMARPGMTEAQVTGAVNGVAVAGGGNLSFPIICSINGQTLHNHSHANTLESGRLLLVDSGAETAMGYAGDMTRTFPVDPTFTHQQKEIYQIVLDAENAAIEALGSEISYRDVHLLSASVIASGLKSLGLMKGNVDEAVAQGAHALFFPHGLGHMMGLDVHDMEDLGEDYVGYDDEVRRSDQFGTAYLRLGRRLKPGFVLTVEPGIYFIPELTDQWKSQGLHTDFINYDKLDAYRGFGGIRIEEDYLITEEGSRLLGKPLAKTIEEVENVRNS